MEHEELDVDEDREEIGDMRGVAQKDADGDDGEGLPVGDLVGLEGVVLDLATEAEESFADGDAYEE